MGDKEQGHNMADVLTQLVTDQQTDRPLQAAASRR